MMRVLLSWVNIMSRHSPDPTQYSHVAAEQAVPAIRRLIVAHDIARYVPKHCLGGIFFSGFFSCSKKIDKVLSTQRIRQRIALAAWLSHRRSFVTSFNWHKESVFRMKIKRLHLKCSKWNGHTRLSSSNWHELPTPPFLLFFSFFSLKHVTWDVAA